MSSAQLHVLVGRLEAVTSQLEGPTIQHGLVSPSISTGRDLQVPNEEPTVKGASPVRKSAPYAPAIKSEQPKTPILRLEDKKWLVEHQVDQQLTIEDTELKQAVYVFQCENTTITVKGKINSITCDSCKKVGIIFDDLVSTVEFVNCKRMQVQANCKVPTVSIDKTDGCQIYLTQSATDAEIVCAKSSEVNILISDPEGESKEHALPEQFRSVWNGKGFTTKPTESV